jgi:hypothetical protein
MRAFLFLICVATALAMTAGESAHGAPRPSIFFADSSSEQPGGIGALELFVSLAASAPTTESLTFTAPAGYVLTPKGIGEQLGVAAVTVTDATRRLPRPLVGVIVETDPATSVPDPVLQVCAPGPHAALWQLSLLGSAHANVPIAVDRLASGGSYKLTVCLDGLWAAKLVPIQLDLGLVDVHNPATTGVYDWSALVTPFDAAGKPDITGDSELRGDAPLPQVLTTSASYRTKTKRLVVHGRLLVAGKPRAGVTISFAGFSTGGAVSELGSARTAANGSYVLSKRSLVRMRFVSAQVAISTRACTGTTTAPHGCTSESLPGTDAGPATVTVLKG